MITNKKKFFGSILGVILFTIVVLAFSYASYIWKSEDTIVTFDINDSYFYCESGIEVVLNGLNPVLDYRSGSYQTFKVNNIGRTATRFSLSLNVTNIDDSLKSESFKYKLMVDKTGGSNNCADVNNSNCIEVEGGSGNFSSIKTGMNTLVSSIEIPNNIRYQYYLFMYIDGNMENDVSMQNSSITSTLDVCETVVFLNYNGGSGNKEFLKVTSTYEGLPTPTRDNSVVTYQTNGGSSVSSETITYTFDGWYLEEDFQTRITASSTVTTPTNHTLYAKWIASKSITLPTTTKTGSTFNGWYSDSGLTSKVGNAGQTYNPVSSITLYAKWAKNTYTIAYTLNGGTKGTNAPTSGTYDTDVQISNPTKTVTVTGNVNSTGATVGSATSKAQTFAGWTSSSSAGLGSNAKTGTSASPSTAWSGSATKNTYFRNLRDTSGTVTLTATWTPVAFNLPTVTKTGYTCKWNTKSDGSGTNYNSGASYTPSATSAASVTMYAVCTKNIYTIAYTYNGGTKGTNAPTSGTYDTDVQISNPTKTVTVTGNVNGTGATVGSATSKAQTFAGWTSSSSAGLGSNAKTGTSASPSTAWSGSATKNTYFRNLRDTSGTVTLTATWTPVAFNLPTVTKTGYTCKWNTKSDGSGTNYNSGASYTPSATSAASVTLYARCTANTYTIAYTYNGGTKGTNAPTSGTYDTDVQISNPTKTVTVTGNVNGTGATVGSSTSKAQTFAGWTSNSSAGLGSNAKTGTAANPSTAWSGSATKNTYFRNLRDTSGTVTLTATWTAVAFNLPTVTKTGYTCKWNTKSDGSGTNYNSGASYTPSATSAASITMYAVCTKNTYTIAYTYNGGTAGTNAPTSGTYDTDVQISNPTKTVTVTGNANSTGATVGSATSKAQTFAGWTSSSSAGLGSNAKTGTSASPSTAWSGSATKNTYFRNLRDTSGTVTLTATWTPVAFNLPTVTKTGYTCKWNTKSDGSGTNYNSGASYTPSATSAASVTLYARCTANTYTIAYTYNGGTKGTNAPTSGTYDTDVQISNPTKTVTVTGNVNGTGATVGSATSKAQTFAGWTSSSSAGLGSNAKTGTAANPSTAWSGSATKNTYFRNLRDTSGTVTLTATWTAVAFNLPTVTKTGYTCKWNTKSDGSGTNYNSGGSYTPSATSAASVTMYAVCTKNTYTIAYTYNGGTKGTNAPTSGTYDTDVQISNPTKTVTVTGNVNGTGATVGNATSKAQTFAGWTSSSSAGLGSNAKTGTSASPSTAWSGSATKNTYFRNLRDTSGTVTLTATWTPVAFNLPTVTKTGYTCKWNTKSDGSGTNYNSGASYTPSATSAASITMYAVCTINSYTLTVKPNGGTWNSTTTDSTFTQNYNTTKSISVPNPTAYYTISYNGNGGTTPTSTKAYRAFAGWSNAGSGTITSNTPVATATQTYTFGAGNGTLTATYSGTANSTATATSSRIYTITYNVNGTGATSSASTGKVDYTMNGWFTAASGGTKRATNGGSYAPTASETLYAQWTTGSTTLATITKTGYTCTWNTKSDGSGTSYASGKTGYTTSANLTLYARCTANTYTIAYAYNGGTKGTNAPTSGTYDTDVQISNPTKTVTVTGNANSTGATIGSATSKAQTFAGWTSSSSAGLGSNAKTGTSASPTASWTGNAIKNTYFRNLRDTSGTVTLTATWTPVAFNLPTVTKTGYTCKWNTKSDGSGTNYNSGVSYTPSATSAASITMYAICTVNQYTLTVKPNGGTWNNTTSDSTIKQDYGTTKSIVVPTPPSSYKVTFNPNGGTISNATATSDYTFTGWTKEGAGSITTNTPIATTTQTFTFGAGSTTLTASYNQNSVTLGTPSREHTITYNSNSTGASIEKTTDKVTYDFNGWYTATSGGSFIGAAGATYLPTATITLYAQWTSKSTTLSTISKPGYTCKWNTKSDGSGTDYSSGATYTPTANITLYAKCTANSYLVKFDANGGSTSQNLKTVTYGSSYGTLPTPTRTDYTFNGWYTATSGGTNITSSSTVSTASNHTLYAHWTANVTSISATSYTQYYTSGTAANTAVTISVTYADGSTKSVNTNASSYTTNNVDSQPTRYVFTVSYGGKSTSYTTYKNGAYGDYRWNNGSRVDGWVQVGSNWYYYMILPNMGGDEITQASYNSYWSNHTSSQMLKGNWAKIKQSSRGKYHWYYFNSDGTMKTGWWNSGTAWYYFVENGVTVTDWVGPVGSMVACSNGYEADDTASTCPNSGNRTISGSSTPSWNGTYQFDYSGRCISSNC